MNGVFYIKVKKKQCIIGRMENSILRAADTRADHGNHLDTFSSIHPN